MQEKERMSYERNPFARPGRPGSSQGFADCGISHFFSTASLSPCISQWLPACDLSVSDSNPGPCHSRGVGVSNPPAPGQTPSMCHVTHENGPHQTSKQGLEGNTLYWQFSSTCKRSYTCLVLLSLQSRSKMMPAISSPAETLSFKHSRFKVSNIPWGSVSPLDTTFTAYLLSGVLKCWKYSFSVLFWPSAMRSTTGFLFLCGFPRLLSRKCRPLPLAISEPSFRTQIGNGSIPAKQVPFLDILVFSHGEFI